MKWPGNQKGFGAFEGVLIGLLLIAVGAAGYFAYQARQDNTDYSVNVAKKQTKTSKSTETNTSTDNAASIVQAFYDAHIQGHSTDDVLAKQYGTQNLINYINTPMGGDPILCGQQGTSRASAKATGSGTAAVVRVSITDGNPASYDVQVKLVQQNDKLLIDKISCPSS
jgi:Tfp pilus assembly protein PilV